MALVCPNKNETTRYGLISVLMRTMSSLKMYLFFLKFIIPRLSTLSHVHINVKNVRFRVNDNILNEITKVFLTYLLVF